MSLSAMMNMTGTNAVQQPVSPIVLKQPSADASESNKLLFFDHVPDVRTDAVQWYEEAKRKQETEEINSQWAEKVPNPTRDLAERDTAAQLISEINSEIRRLRDEGYTVETPGQTNGNAENARKIRNLETCRDALGEKYGLDTSPQKADWGKLTINTLQRGADAFSGGVVTTLDMLARGAANILTLGDINDETWNSLNLPTTALKRQLDREAAQHERDREAAVGDSSWARVVSDIGTPIIAALPQAFMAWATGGASLGTTTAELQAASLAAGGGLSSTVYNAVDKVAKNPRFWASFAQTAGNDYEQAKADGADEFSALNYAFTNSAISALIEVSGGTDTLPEELRAADKAGESGKVYDYLRNSVNMLTGGDQNALPAAGKSGSMAYKLLKSAAGEGNEEVLQGAIGRGLQNSIYNKGNQLISLTDPNAVLNPFMAAREWGMGSTVGGVLSAGMAGVNKLVGAINQSGAAKTQSGTGKKPVSSAQITARLTDMLTPYDPTDNYWKNSAAMGRPLSAFETIAIDSMNDGVTAAPNKLVEGLVQRFGWDAVFGNAKMPMLAGAGAPLEAAGLETYYNEQAVSEKSVSGIGIEQSTDTSNSLGESHNVTEAETAKMEQSTEKVEMGEANDIINKDSNNELMVSEKQFGKKFGKHAYDFGLDPGNVHDRKRFSVIIEQIVKNASEVRAGAWRGQKNNVLFFICGDDVVVADDAMNFITVLKGGVNNERVKNAGIKQVFKIF